MNDTFRLKFAKKKETAILRPAQCNACLYSRARWRLDKAVEHQF